MSGKAKKGTFSFIICGIKKNNNNHIYVNLTYMYTKLIKLELQQVYIVKGITLSFEHFLIFFWVRL